MSTSSRTRYSRLVTVEEIGEIGTFEVGAWAVFCFRRPDERTQTNCLNLCATMMSYYLHCEICVFNKDMTDTRSLEVTSETGRVVLGRRRYVRQNGVSPWNFVWAPLDPIHQRDMQTCLASLSGDDAKLFSSNRIFCFHLMSCCSITTTTCSETTMEVLHRVWGFQVPEIRFYSPDDVFKFVTLPQNRALLRVDDARAGKAPDYELRQTTTQQ